MTLRKKVGLVVCKKVAAKSTWTTLPLNFRPTKCDLSLLGPLVRNLYDNFRDTLSNKLFYYETQNAACCTKTAKNYHVVSVQTF